METYCFFYPGIDTTYAPKYTEKAFSEIKIGMASTVVEDMLGHPLLKFQKSGSEEWLFTTDGKCSWGDFAWLRHSIDISNGVVVSINRSIRYD